MRKSFLLRHHYLESFRYNKSREIGDIWSKQYIFQDKISENILQEKKYFFRIAGGVDYIIYILFLTAEMKYT